MILLDANLLVLDLQHPGDPNFVMNRKALDRLKATAAPCGMVAHAFLEVVGKLSHGSALAQIPKLPLRLQLSYQLSIIPDPTTYPEYAGLSFSELMFEISYKRSLGDSVLSGQIRKFAPHASLLLTWNAKHFVGKTVIPVLTPAEWLQQQQGNTP